MTEKIFFNGRVYNSENEMPSEVRQLYARINKFFLDENQDGIPDIIQNQGLRGLKEVFDFAKTISKNSQSEKNSAPDRFNIVRYANSKIYVNGKDFDSAENMPSDIRNTYEKTIQSVNTNDSEIYDEPWREIDRDSYFEPHDDEIMLSKPALQPNMIQNVTSNQSFLLVILIAGIVLCAGSVMWLAMNGFIQF